MNITVIGTGRWGTFIAWYLDSIGNRVMLYGIPGTPGYDVLKEKRDNGMVKLTDGMVLTSDISSVHSAEVIIISVGSQNLRELCVQLRNENIRNKNIVLCMKGLEIGTGARLTEIVEAELGDRVKVAVWIGPGHPQEFANGIPNCMVIDSRHDELKKYLVEHFSSQLIRFYYGADLIGNEIGAASKNVIGIAAGMLDGLEMSSLKGALMSRGTREIARLINAVGGNELSAYGLCHLGDYEATVFSKYSHNRMFGECLVKGEQYGLLAEGAYTVKAILPLAEKYGVELPICSAVYDVIYGGKPASDVLKNLFLRSLKQEF